MEQELYFKWYHTFLFFFQTVLSIADTVTDILLSLNYKKQGHHEWFAVSLGVTVVAIIVLCVWSSIASTLRTLTKQDDADVEGVNPDFIFRHPVVNVLLSCLCFGPALHSLQLFFVCALRFKDLWKSERGIRIEKAGRLYYLYTHNLNLKMVEGLLESAPQLLIQLYVMLAEQSEISTIQMISVPVSFIMLTWMITSTERYRELTNNDIKLHHHVLLFIGNAGIIVARSVAIVAFTLIHEWLLAVMLLIHFFLTITCGYMLWRSKRKQDILTFIFAYSPLYLFVYNRYYLSKLRGNARFSIQLQNFVSIAWHVLFFAENITMIMLYYTAHHADQPENLSNVGLGIVVVGNVGGLLFKCLIRHCCFELETQFNDPRQRAVTIQVRTLPRQV